VWFSAGGRRFSHLWPDTEDGTREAVDMVLGRMRFEALEPDASTQ
jgi:hypothetical protein